MEDYIVDIGYGSLRIRASSALDAELQAIRDGYTPRGATVPVNSDDGNEFEGMTPRQLRQLCRTMQDDLRKAVTDRQTLLTVLDAIYNTAWSGMDESSRQRLCHDGVAHNRFARICNEVAKAKAIVEGKG